MRVRMILQSMVAAIILIGAASVGQAQNESGIRPLNKERFQQWGAWYDSTTAVFQVRYPIIRSLPPLNSGMPFDILLSYICADSLARFDNSNTALFAVGGWRTMNDTLKGALTYSYKMVDYNPIIFNQYIHETHLKSSKYHTNLVPVVENLRKAMLRALPARAEKFAFYSAYYPDYILRIKVLTIDSAQKKISNPSDAFTFRVTAEVLDTLKGHVFAGCNAFQEGNSRDHAVPQSNGACIQFQYSHWNYYHGDQADESYNPHVDPAFSTATGGFKMQIGQEAVVFISHTAPLNDSLADYFDLNLEPQASYNALPIVSGMVRDVNHFWSNADQMPYSDWKKRFLEIRGKILSGNY